MMAMTKARLDVVPLSKHIGAEIRGLDLHDKPDDEAIKAIYQAWLDHLVIVFPDQKLEQEDLVRVTGYFGEMGMPRRPPQFFPKGYSRLLPGIMLISNIREKDRKSTRLNSSHSQISYAVFCLKKKKNRELATQPEAQ